MKLEGDDGYYSVETVLLKKNVFKLRKQRVNCKNQPTSNS